jgi:hypothetical protein
LITLPVDVEKFDLGGDWAIVTVVFCPSLTEVYWARYVRFFERLMLFVSALRLSGETARPDAGSAGTRTRAPRPTATVMTTTRVRMSKR